MENESKKDFSPLARAVPLPAGTHSNRESDGERARGVA